jgi:hypothetical protein
VFTHSVRSQRELPRRAREYESIWKQTGHVSDGAGYRGGNAVTVTFLFGRCAVQISAGTLASLQDYHGIPQSLQAQPYMAAVRYIKIHNLSTEIIYVLRVFLTVSSDSFPKEH